jgi:hypothetical protein
MEPRITLHQSDGSTNASRKRIRKRRALPPPESRDWLTPTEAALALGCSVATVHRMRRGLIVGTRPLPCSQYGRKIVFRKASLERWQDENEKTVLA